MKKMFMVALLALQAWSADAAAQVITFDDIYTADNVQISNGYAGLNWDNFYIQNSGSPGYEGSGFAPGTVSGTNVGFNGWTDPASFSSATEFNLVSAYVTQAWPGGDSIAHFVGYSGSDARYFADIAVSTTAPTLATFNWSGVTKVMLFTNGFSAVLDNVTISAVPEPETYALMATGLLFGFMARRRKQQAV